jgi:hypothetical protein
MQTAFVFVCQSGELEAKAAILAASLRRHLPADAVLVALVPQPESDWGRLADHTLRFLESLGVRIASVENPIGPGYPIGNKISCVDVDVPADRVVFLDSDIVVLDDLDPGRHFRGEFMAKPADVSHTFGGDASHWSRIYALCGCPEPSRRVMPTVRGDLMWPYFNAGVIAVPAGSGFGREWADCSRRIDADDSIPSRRPHLDQIALPVAVARAGLRFTPLPETLNYPAHLKPLPPRLPTVCHYHWPRVIAGEPRLLEALATLLHTHAPLEALLRREAGWAELADACRQPRSSAPPAIAPAAAPGGRRDGLITGIPRSGTSLLCRLLDDVPGQVVINEPSEIFPVLNRDPPQRGLAELYCGWRGRVRAREPIENKVVDGRIIEDTATIDVRVPHVARVDGDDFVLWTKNTLAYAARLPRLAMDLPAAVFVACVRHPFDAIASWIGTFAHLRDADVERFPIGGPADPLLTDSQRAAVAIIRDCAAPALRRALLWRHLALTLLDRREDVHIVRYEDLVADPGGEVARILGLVAPSTGPAASIALPALTARSRRAALSVADIEAIADVCTEPAAAFGYELHVDAVAALRNRDVRA